MELNIDEALRYLGVRGPAPEELRREMERTAERLTTAVQPRWVYRVYDLVHEEDGFHLPEAGVVLTGRTAETMLAQCDQAVLLACTIGAGFDARLRTEQVRDMSRAVILDACGSAWVESGCDAAEREIAERFPGRFLTDRFSPGYGDLPLTLQPSICGALDTARRIGVCVSDSLLMHPVKSVTAVIGLSDRPQMARVRGCAYCAGRETCTIHKGGNHCGI